MYVRENQIFQTETVPYNYREKKEFLIFVWKNIFLYFSKKKLKCFILDVFWIALRYFSC